MDPIEVFIRIPSDGQTGVRDTVDLIAAVARTIREHTLGPYRDVGVKVTLVPRTIPFQMAAE